MAYYGNNYYEREVIRDTPCDSYSEFNRVEGGYGRPAYPIGHHHNHHHNPHNVVTDVVYESSTIPSYGHHHHHGGAEVIERKEERIVYENEFDPCRRMY
ncbi:protein kreg-1-like [Chenopodium quinoa]|uniref:protein kreg-1-like n=1 Tax=Chenopodium quinoa TaxID=63459 RepID=UPI000B791BF1|nr:protein kreg-1-like [Chenopodium quinoa]